MEIKDLEDPVEVGTETVYEIRVKNSGSGKAARLSIDGKPLPGAFVPYAPAGSKVVVDCVV